MIVTVTINPLLERRLTFDRIQIGSDNRDGFEELKAGGKGINVSRQLNYLNTDNLAVTFLGGTNGKLLKQILSDEKIKHVAVHTAAETRDASVIIDKSSEQVSTFFSTNSKILKSEAEEFISRLKKIIENCEIVVFSGSSPCEVTDLIFPAGIELANKYDKISICDTYGKHLKNCIDKSPTVIHNNIPELEKSLGISLVSEKERLDFLDFLYGKGIKQSYLTDGENPTLASSFDYHYKILPPEIKAVNSTGSGDAFVAGIIYSWHNALTFEEGLALSAALGAANASRIDVCNVKLEEAESLKGHVKISHVGKKMKTLDVTPG